MHWAVGCYPLLWKLGGALFYKKSPFGQYWTLPQFARLGLAPADQPWPKCKLKFVFIQKEWHKWEMDFHWFGSPKNLILPVASPLVGKEKVSGLYYIPDFFKNHFFTVCHGCGDMN